MKNLLHLFTACPATAGKNMLSTCFSAVFFLAVLFGNNTCLFSQTTNWNGSTSSDWNTAANWSAGVPGVGDHVNIPDVVSPNVDPIIIAAGAVAKSVIVQSGGVLTIDGAAATLAINGSATGQGIGNQGTVTVQNNAVLNIGNSSSVGTNGIFNEAIFNNNTGGTINIGNSTSNGIRNFNGTFTNAANINIGATISPGATGIYNNAPFNNNTGGTIKIDRSTSAAISNQGGTFNNSATLTIGSIASVGLDGIAGNSTFNNNTGGTIKIDNSTSNGINCGGSSFTNSATLTIGELVAPTTLILSTTGTFSNSTGGTLKAKGSISNTNFNNAGGTLSPGYSEGMMTFAMSEDFSSSTMSIEVNGKAVAGTDFDQIVVTGTATLGGTLALTINFPGAVLGDQVPVLTATSRSGMFGSVSGLPGTWFVNYTSSSVILSFGAPLPVELTDFTAHLLEQAIQLDWRTASEINNAGFEIQRSPDGKNWLLLQFEKGNGTTTQAHDYAFLDEKPLPGMNYYRLRQTDFDGGEEFSKVVSIDFPSLEDLESLGLLQAFPNPVSGGELTLLLPVDLKEKTTVQLFSPTGQLVRWGAFVGGAQTMDVSGLAAGVYTLQVRNGAGRFFEKIIMAK